MLLRVTAHIVDVRRGSSNNIQQIARRAFLELLATVSSLSAKYRQIDIQKDKLTYEHPLILLREGRSTFPGLLAHS
jgi:hypothetical protein